MSKKISIVITSISAPNPVLAEIAEKSLSQDIDFILIGDVASPANFSLAGCQFFDLKAQKETPFKISRVLPEKHYCRKNIGYLLAMQRQSPIIIETDDDNMPLDTFWAERKRIQKVPVIANTGWINVYTYFTSEKIWPRGLPLDQVAADMPARDQLETQAVNCPIQQGLADGNPDVDAVYRLVLPLPQSFDRTTQVALSRHAWCPFNSQNTTWWPDCYPLLYLPAYCSFRMTDIWRSFVAQAIAWANDWSILFHGSTVFQERNEHNLMKDFEQEIPGYLRNAEIAETLADLPLKSGIDNICTNLHLCYEKLVSISIFDPRELDLLDSWLTDIESLGWPNF